MKSFVWLPSQSGPQAQIWLERPMDGNGKLKVIPLFEYVIPESEQHLSLDYFILKFKAPEEKKCLETVSETIKIMN